MARSTADIAAALPEYDVGRELGRGAMGVVYHGRHRNLQRDVAIKELPRAFAVDPAVRHRFGVEARVLASLNHPHVVPVYDYVEKDGLCLLVMESLPGGTVWDRFTNEGLSIPDACAAMLATCSALEHAHKQGILHRDIKPENLMFAADDSVKVTDFGIAKVLSGSQTMATADGSVLGTPAYMAPEQAEGRELTAQVDVYAAGTMLYEMLSGRLPFQRNELMAMLLARVNEDPPDLRSAAPQVPDALADVVMTSVARSTADRYQSAEDFGCALGMAAATAWGPEWLGASGLPVQGSEPIARAARTTLATAVASSGAPGTVVKGPATDASAVDPEGPTGTVIQEPPAAAASDPEGPSGTVIQEPPAAAASDPAGSGGTAVQEPAEPTASQAAPGSGSGPAPTEAAPAAQPVEPVPPVEVETSQINVPPATVMRPQVTHHEAGMDASEVDAGDLVEISEVLKPPGAPVASTILGLLLLFVGVVIASIGVGEPDLVQPLPAGSVELAGQDVATTNPIEVDLDEPVIVSGLLGETAELGLSIVGVPLGTTESADIINGTAELDPGIAPRLASGAVTGTISVFDTAGNEVVAHEVALEATNPWYTSALGVLGALVTLFALAAGESNLRPMRRGRLRPASLVGLAVSGALLGVGVAMLTTAILATQRTVAGLVVPAALCAGGAVVFGIAAARNGRRRRVKRRLEAKDQRK